MRQYVDGCARRLRHDIALFMAFTLLDPARRESFGHQPALVDLHLAKLRETFPDLVTPQVYVQAHAYFAADKLNELVPLPEAIDLRTDAAPEGTKKQAKKGKKKPKKDSEPRTLTVYFHDVGAVFAATMGQFAKLCEDLSTIIPTSVICEQRFSTAADVWAGKRGETGVKTAKAFLHGQDLGNYAKFVAAKRTQQEFGHLADKMK